MTVLDARRFFQPWDRVWLNTAHQGALPLNAVDGVIRALSWKLAPYELGSPDRFSDIPARLRATLAVLLSADQDDIVLSNSASYGLHLLANGLPLADGDEVVVPANDFPSDILPWLLARDRGVNVVLAQPRNETLTPSEVRSLLTPRTKVVCMTWVHSFSGGTIDVAAIGEVVQSAGALFVLNASQGLGATPLAPSELPVDAVVSVGFKWLCGPYGTGLCWFSDRVRDRLEGQKLYWLNALTTDDLAAPHLDIDGVRPPRRGRLDIFGTANFLNFMPFNAAVEFLLDYGIPAIHAHNQGLVDRFLGGLDWRRFRLVSPGDGPSRSSLVVIEPIGEDASAVVSRLYGRGVDVAHRAGRIRLSPHLYNDDSDIDEALAALSG